MSKTIVVALNSDEARKALFSLLGEPSYSEKYSLGIEYQFGNSEDYLLIQDVGKNPIDHDESGRKNVKKIMKNASFLYATALSPEVLSNFIRSLLSLDGSFQFVIENCNGLVLPVRDLMPILDDAGLWLEYARVPEKRALP